MSRYDADSLATGENFQHINALDILSPLAWMVPKMYSHVRYEREIENADPYGAPLIITLTAASREEIPPEGRFLTEYKEGDEIGNTSIPTHLDFKFTHTHEDTGIIVDGVSAKLELIDENDNTSV